MVYRVTHSQVIKTTAQRNKLGYTSPNQSSLLQIIERLQ